MRILYVAGQFPRTSESFVRNEVRAQLDAGHDVRVVSLRPPEPAAARDGAGTMRTAGRDRDLARDLVVTVPRLPLVRPFVPGAAERAVPEERWTRKAYATVAARWVVERGVGGFAPDLVHAHFANLPALVAGHIAALLAVPYTFMPHATDYRRRMSDDLLARRVRHADAVFVVSHAARREIAERAGLRPAEAAALQVVRAAVRPLATDGAAQDAPAAGHAAQGSGDPAQHARSAGDTGPRLVSIARQVPMKGLDIALRAFAQLRARHPGARYDLVGDGPERARLEALAARLGIAGAVRFHGLLGNDDAQRVLAGADIAVLPCRRDSHGAADGLPVFLMEAGALGVPVITTGISGIGELVVDGEGGLLVPSDDVGALAGALERLAGDAALRARLAAGLRARVRDEFDRDRQVRRLHATWERLVAPAPAAPAARADHPPAGQPLSIVVVARDEADVITRCVAAASWADEVVVAVDSTTRDDTAARARDAGAQVHTVGWRGFSATKNDAAKLARHDWVLSLDADEVVGPRLRRGIAQALAGHPDPRDGFAPERRSDFLGVLLPNDTRAATRRSAVRLYHRAHGAWDETMTVHEVVRVPGAMHPLPGALVQWRDFDLDELLARFNRYATVEARELAARGRRARALDVALRPLLRFGWHYVARGELRLGGRGLVHSGLKAAGEFMRWAKLWELQRAPARAGGHGGTGNSNDIGGALARALRDC